MLAALLLDFLNCVVGDTSSQLVTRTCQIPLNGAIPDPAAIMISGPASSFTLLYIAGADLQEETGDEAGHS